VSSTVRITVTSSGDGSGNNKFLCPYLETTIEKMSTKDLAKRVKRNN